MIKLFSCCRICFKLSSQLTRDCTTMMFMYSSYFHTKMLRSHRDGHILCTEYFLEIMIQRHRESLLCLWPTRSSIYQSGKFTQSENLVGRDIRNMAKSDEWLEVMLTERPHGDVFHEDDTIIASFLRIGKCRHSSLLCVASLWYSHQRDQVKVSA